MLGPFTPIPSKGCAWTVTFTGKEESTSFATTEFLRCIVQDKLSFSSDRRSLAIWNAILKSTSAVRERSIAIHPSNRRRRIRITSIPNTSDRRFLILEEFEHIPKEIGRAHV